MERPIGIITWETDDARLANVLLSPGHVVKIKIDKAKGESCKNNSGKEAKV